MIKYNLYLLWLFVFITSCNGQEKTKLSEKLLLQEQSVKLDTMAQISEYVVEIFEDTKSNLWFGTIGDGVARYNGKTLTYFSTKDGLCDNTVVGIAEDKEGNMWFGTHNGISKYDGKIFTTFAETKGHISGCKILIDSKGQIWAGTTEAAFRYNGSSFSKFKIPNPVIDNPSYKVAAGKVWSILEDKKGNIWFGRDGLGACKFDGTSFTHFTQKDGLCSNNVSEIVEDKQGNIWFACLSYDLPKPIIEGGICRYDGKTFTKYPEMEGLSKNDIYSVYADKKGDIWMGATGLGVYQFDGKSFKFYKGTDRMDLTWSMGIQSILEDRNGTLWFGFSGGLFRFKDAAITNVPKTGLWKGVENEQNTMPIGQLKQIKTQSLNKGDNVHCSLQDKSGNLWFGTTGDGVYKYDGKSFTQFTTSNGLNHNMVNHILEDKDGKIWIGTTAGLILYNGKTFTEIQIPVQKNMPPNKYHNTHDVFSIMQDKSGKLWFATIDGVYIYEGKSFTSFIVNEGVGGYKNTNNNVEYILEDKAGDIWFGGRGNTGVFRYDGKSITNLKPNGDNWAWPVLQDKNGNIWFSNWSGAYRYDGKSFTSFTKKDGLSGDMVTRIIEDKKGNLWFGGGGICSYDGKSFTCFKDGLINQGVWSILEDKSGNFWVGTNETGLYLYDGKTFANFSAN